MLFTSYYIYTSNTFGDKVLEERGFSYLIAKASFCSLLCYKPVENVPI